MVSASLCPSVHFISPSGLPAASSKDEETRRPGSSEKGLNGYIYVVAQLRRLLG